MQINGLSNLSGWRWIFVVRAPHPTTFPTLTNKWQPQIEGLLTMLLGIGSYFIIVDFPEDSPKSFHFLNEAEAAFVVARIQHDRSDTFVEPFSVKSYLKNAGLPISQLLYQSASQLRVFWP
jgi:hypothetical protein